ncbi:MAG TPA: hypothetical protein QGF95_03040 [Candidatus Latescibacteria bacterium]|jgi:hypothetical protein|nr:hypothetical protein [Gemmatimonadaceae bacterium]MDP6018520.1 hypothetical protein [Candidatus Latescibacterota bacterium]MDP7339580.1 hypothetical protein [Vicinamibacterales bacterium]HJP29512.1 hypothetical protein [Candidatus Latescibacterota bacterium]
MIRTRRSLFSALASIGLTAYVVACFFGHAGYVLCAESDGSLVVEAASLNGCDCPVATASADELHGLDGCGPCDDASLTEDAARSETGPDAPRLTVSLLPADPRADRRPAITRRQACLHEARHPHLVHSPILLI